MVEKVRASAFSRGCPASSRLATSFVVFSKASSLLLPPGGVGLPGNKMALFFREAGPYSSENEVGYLVVHQAEIVSGAGDGDRTRDPLLGRQMLFFARRDGKIYSELWELGGINNLLSVQHHIHHRFVNSRS